MCNNAFQLAMLRCKLKKNIAHITGPLGSIRNLWGVGKATYGLPYPPHFVEGPLVSLVTLIMTILLLSTFGVPVLL